MKDRRLESIIAKDIKRKMVLIAGPCQCGKTTLAKDIAKTFNKNFTYYRQRSTIAKFGLCLRINF